MGFCVGGRGNDWLPDVPTDRRHGYGLFSIRMLLFFRTAWFFIYILACFIRDGYRNSMKLEFSSVYFVLGNKGISSFIETRITCAILFIFQKSHLHFVIAVCTFKIHYILLIAVCIALDNCNLVRFSLLNAFFVLLFLKTLN